MSSDHSQILSAFRKQLSDDGIIRDGDTLGTDDQTLLRFLRARKFNLKQSKKMIADCQRWRSTVEGVGIDELYKRTDPFDYPERGVVFQHWPMWFHKTDKKGRPLNVHFFGGINMNELHKHVSPTRHWETILVNAECLTREILPAASRKAGRPIGQCFVIVDLKGFSLSAFWQIQNLVRSSFQISQDYYPETMGQLAIINAPSSFTFIWSIIKPWLAKETAEKVEILGGDYKEVLLKLVDEDCLPAVVGGGCLCEGQGGCSFSGVGPWLEGRVGWGPGKPEIDKSLDGEKTTDDPVETKSPELAVTGSQALVDKTPIQKYENGDLPTVNVVPVT